MTTIGSTSSGKNFIKFCLTKQNDALVFSAKYLYFCVSKKVRSPFWALARGLILVITLLVDILGKKFLRFTLFFFKKINLMH